MIDGAIVAVHGRHGKAVGFLIDDCHVVTCAHVLDPELGAVAPDHPPEIFFPLLQSHQPLTTEVAHWLPDPNIDIAVLRLLGDLPSGALPAPVDDGSATTHDLWGCAIAFFGFPEAVDDGGIWAEAQIKGRQANGWLQLEDDRARGYFIERGFSGTPIWDAEARAVRGIVLARDRNGSVRVGYAVPIAVILSAVPALTPRRVVTQAHSAPARATPPTLFRYLLDRTVPRLHRWMTHWRWLADPGGRAALRSYLDGLRKRMEEQSTNYLPLSARSMPASLQLGPLDRHRPEREVTRIVRQRIRLFVSGLHGDTAGSAQIALLNRRSKLIRNLHATLLRSKSTLVLLGDPGTGKSMTLREVARRVVEREQYRVFPCVPIFVRLGNLQLPANPSTEDVLRYIVNQLPASVGAMFGDLFEQRRLIILFDGMDEMSRSRYVEYVRVLSAFAAEYGDWIKTLFSCRINDFSPEFRHRQLVLIPFAKAQIQLYLATAMVFPIAIGGRQYTARELTASLMHGDLPIEPSNPMNLFLLASYVDRNQAFPRSRAALFESYIVEAFRQRGQPMADAGKAFSAWSLLGFEITRRNQGALIDTAEAFAVVARSSLGSAASSLIAAGLRCGVLVEELHPEGTSLRFSHHRLQEYFAARHLKSSDDRVDWPPLLDAPRWQETLVNLVAMGHGEPAVRSLVSLIEGQLESMGAEADDESQDSDDELQDIEKTKLIKQRATGQRLLAERVELAARVLSERHSDLTAVDAMLSPALTRAATHLVRDGNPSSQVRMLSAGRVLPSKQFANFVNDLLQSKLAWVRTQALVVATENASVVRMVGSDVPFEMARDIGAAQFVGRAWTYLKFLRRGSGLKLAWMFGAAVVAQATYALLLIAAIVGGAFLALYLSQPDRGLWAEFSGWSDAVYWVVPAVAGLIGVTRDWRFLPNWIFGGVAASCLWAVFSQLVSYNLERVHAASMQLAFSFFVALLLAPLGTILICGISLSVYLVLGGAVFRRQQMLHAMNLMAIARQLSGCLILMMGGGIMTLLIGTVLILEWLMNMKSDLVLAGRAWNPRHVAYAIMSLIGAALAVTSAVINVRDNIKKHGSLSSWLAWAVKNIDLDVDLAIDLDISEFLKFLLLVGIWGAVCVGVFVLIERYGLARYLFLAVYWASGLFLVGFAIHKLFRLCQRLLRKSGWLKLQLSVDQWRRRFEQAVALEQVELLEIVSAQGFGVPSSGLLDLLIELESKVEVAARDQYWSVRYQVELAAKQERAS